MPYLVDKFNELLLSQPVQDWAQGVQERTKHPLESFTKTLKDIVNAPPEELAKNLLGVGVIAGVGAKTANLISLKLAQELKAYGIPDRVIKSKTGWFFGAADGKPRFQISDASMELDPYVKSVISESVANEPIKGKLDSIITHDKLFKAYPFLRDVEVSIEKLPSGSNNIGNHTNYPSSISISGGDSTSIKDLLVHEIQHPIQHFEDFSRGVPLNSGIHNTASGEVEARLVELQREMTKKQLSKLYPIDHMDIPVSKQQIINWKTGYKE